MRDMALLHCSGFGLNPSYLTFENFVKAGGGGPVVRYVSLSKIPNIFHSTNVTGFSLGQATDVCNK